MYDTSFRLCNIFLPCLQLSVLLAHDVSWLRNTFSPGGAAFPVCKWQRANCIVTSRKWHFEHDFFFTDTAYSVRDQLSKQQFPASSINISYTRDNVQLLNCSTKFTSKFFLKVTLLFNVLDVTLLVATFLWAVFSLKCTIIPQAMKPSTLPGIRKPQLYFVFP